ncbi:MAG: lipoprotein-releasing ABC transporter ATP-binding protein LolD [Gammaproteobacteria bacterium]|nr:lipoprotein-releasing ABC transporter ATP-binding protein LolD [Gammaproteobacteria bacterium]
MSDDQDAVLICRGVSKSYTQGDADIHVLNDINLSVIQGARIAVVGMSGAGKSTLLHLLGGLDQPSSGQISIAGQDIAGLNEKKLGQLRNRTLGFVYQFHHLLPEFSALENVAMPLLIAGIKHEQASKQASDMLARVGLEQRINHKPSELSGGERQRAAIARALINSPNCVLADEPTGNLDNRTARRVYELFLELNTELNTSLVMVTHDESMAAGMDHVWHLAEGQLRFS